MRSDLGPCYWFEWDMAGKCLVLCIVLSVTFDFVKTCEEGLCFVEGAIVEIIP